MAGKRQDWTKAKRLRPSTETAAQRRLTLAADRVLREAEQAHVGAKLHRKGRPKKARATPPPKDLTKKLAKDRERRWPIILTIGPHPVRSGELHVIQIASRVEADRCGYSWVGRFK